MINNLLAHKTVIVNSEDIHLNVTIGKTDRLKWNPDCLYTAPLQNDYREDTPSFTNLVSMALVTDNPISKLQRTIFWRSLLNLRISNIVENFFK